MKGTFAQAELHIIRARLHGGREQENGWLGFAVPTQRAVLQCRQPKIQRCSVAARGGRAAAGDAGDRFPFCVARKARVIR
jgi:hypothetical protein